MQHPVAFFDIDGTVFRSSLLIKLVEALVDAEVYPTEATAACRAKYTAWKNREGSYEAYIEAVIASFLQYLQGVSYGDLVDVGHDLVDKESKQVYRYTRDLIAELRAEGYYLVAISQSPKLILDPFCLEYGFDKVYGRFYEIGPTDKFTGQIVDEHLIQNKANIVQRVLTDTSLTKVGSVAVGDTDGDISMLELVDRPICFNPNQKLYNYAKTQGWEVVVERKDVIYTL